MRRTTTDPARRSLRSARGGALAPAGDADPAVGVGPVGVTWSTRRVLVESERVVRRLQQLESRPWWRVSERELDELDARLRTLRAHAGGAQH